MDISKKAIALLAASAVGIGGIASIGAQAFAQTSTLPSTPVAQVQTLQQTAAPEVTGQEAKGSAVDMDNVQSGDTTGSDTGEVKSLEKDAPGGPDVQSGHQDAPGTGPETADVNQQ